MYHHILSCFQQNNWNWNNISGLVRDVIVSVAAIISIPSLNRWREREATKDDRELAKKILKAVYKVRDAVAYVRSPWISIAEQSAAAKEKAEKEKDITFEEIMNSSNKRIETVYSARWQKVVEAMSELDATTLEAEVMWGKDIIEKEKDLKNYVRVLFINIDNYLNYKERQIKFDREIIYGSMGADDNFNEEIEKAVKKIDGFVGPYLRIKK